MRENTNQKNSKYGHFSRSVGHRYFQKLFSEYDCIRLSKKYNSINPEKPNSPTSFSIAHTSAYCRELKMSCFKVLKQLHYVYSIYICDIYNIYIYIYINIYTYLVYIYIYIYIYIYNIYIYVLKFKVLCIMKFYVLCLKFPKQLHYV